MMKYIQIRNAGNIEQQALMLLGASTKRHDDSKIGFFGSGVKYTVAYLLRHDLDFKVFSGTEEIKFSTKEVNLRDQQFHQVLVNGTETSITTSWGENWDRWQIFREVVTNAFDENNFDISLTDTINPVEGLTSFYLNYEDFKQYYDNLDQYFNEELLKETRSSIISKGSASKMKVFKKGIRIIEEESELVSLFDYHLIDADLNEERIASEWEIRYHVSRLLMRCDDKEIIKVLYSALQNNENHLFEVKEVLSNPSTYTSLSEKWLEVINESEVKVIPEGSAEFIEQQKGEGFLDSNKVKSVPAAFINKAKESFGDNYKGSFDQEEGVREDYVVLSQSGNLQGNALQRNLKELESYGIHFRCDVELARFKDPYKDTLIDNDTLYVNVDRTRNTEELVQALVEGYVAHEYSVMPSNSKAEKAYKEVLASILVHRLL
jgi:hypothetical protein